jgi:methylated-DNA-[protein]-cysteine S-methyltransferase
MHSRSPELSNLRHWLLKADDLPILEIAKKKKIILSRLTALTYDSDSIVSIHAIRLTGLVANIISKRDPEYVRNYLLRLFWLVNDESGGICWKAPELIGEILYHCPQFSQFFPMLISLLDLEKEDAPRFRAGTLRAIGRVAQADKKAMLPALEDIRLFASWDYEPDTMEIAVWCLNQMTK